MPPAAPRAFTISANMTNTVAVIALLTTVVRNPFSNFGIILSFQWFELELSLLHLHGGKMKVKTTAGTNSNEMTVHAQAGTSVNFAPMVGGEIAPSGRPLPPAIAIITQPLM